MHWIPAFEGSTQAPRMHIAGARHDPQLSAPPQPSEMAPHVIPSSAHERGTHGGSHRFALHSDPWSQMPQDKVEPPTKTCPHWAPSSIQFPGRNSQWPAALHTSPSGHSPQDTTSPQPSEAKPHALLGHGS